eukprot:m.81600 g.81600  ORF g.81600 m.81600 type:complete len:508 (-) comp14575_c1_seq1:559-2082(-)
MSYAPQHNRGGMRGGYQSGFQAGRGRGSYGGRGGGGYHNRGGGGGYRGGGGGYSRAQPRSYGGSTPRQAFSGDMPTNQRPTVDHHAAIVRDMEERMFRKGTFDRTPLQPKPVFSGMMLPPVALPRDCANSITTKFFNVFTAKTQTAIKGESSHDGNKSKSPAFCLRYNPMGRRLISGHSTGELALWYACTYNFENISSVHQGSVRCMNWSNNKKWLLSGDDNGTLNYLQANMNTVAQIHAHSGPVRGVGFSPTDNKFCSGSDDKSVKVFDFYTLKEELELRGHGADVRCVAWHPHQALIASGSRDQQQSLRLWDPKSSKSLARLELHKDGVLDLKWHRNGNWLLSASNDSLIKLFDLRAMKEIQTFRAHSKAVEVVQWHPVHDDLFASGGAEGGVYFWLAGTDSAVGSLPQAHAYNVWDMDWHPLGHVLATAANDHKLKIWTRHQPGERMDEEYNASEVQAAKLFEEAPAFDAPSSSRDVVIPGMDAPRAKRSYSESAPEGAIPGLD